MKVYQKLIEKAKKEFIKILSSGYFKKEAIKFLDIWLTNRMFSFYIPHIAYLMNCGKWELLLDSFCKLINFGTGGIRGVVGVGPNRINICTIKFLAQGYSQYLIKKFGNLVSKKGIVVGYDMRKYFLEGIDEIKREAIGSVSSYELALSAASVYVANGIKVYFFDSVESTPNISFFIKYFNAVGGSMFTASHNPFQYNGKKLYNEHGSQIVFPDDKNIFVEVNSYLKEVKELKLRDVFKSGLIKYVDCNIKQAPNNVGKYISFKNKRKIGILYSPMHGTGIVSVFPVLLKLGFDIKLSRYTSNLSGNFENIPFGLPNPEVKKSFDYLVKEAKFFNINVILSTDSDADRIGLMVFNNKKWFFFDGNNIGIIIANYIFLNFKKNPVFLIKPLFFTTVVTTLLISRILGYGNIFCSNYLPVGFKYIFCYMNGLDKRTIREKFLFGLEQSNGYFVGGYYGDKDASGVAILLIELLAELKNEDGSLIEYLNYIYYRYGYNYNSLISIGFHGVKGIKQIDHILNFFRIKKFTFIDLFRVKKKVDCLFDKNVFIHNTIIFLFKKINMAKSIRLILRPSGTEPKLKVYIEFLSFSFVIRGNNIRKIRFFFIKLEEKLKKIILTLFLNILNIKVSNKVFLLSEQLILSDKVKYFKIENKIISLININNSFQRYNKLMKMFSFLGNNGISKINMAFSKKYGGDLFSYLMLK